MSAAAGQVLTVKTQLCIGMYTHLKKGCPYDTWKEEDNLRLTPLRLPGHFRGETHSAVKYKEGTFMKPVLKSPDLFNITNI